MTAKNLAQFPRRQPADAVPQDTLRRSGPAPLAPAAKPRDSEALTAHFLRSLNLLLRAVQLYHQHHPRLIESLKSTGQSLDDGEGLAADGAGGTKYGDGFHEGAFYPVTHN